MSKRNLSVTGRSRRALGSCLGALGGVILLGAALLGPSGCSNKETTPTFESPPPPPNVTWFFDVWGSSPTDVYIVGRPNALLHYGADQQWTLQPHPATDVLTAVWGASADSVFAVGYHGTILLNRGGGWSAMTSGTTNDLYDIGRGPGGAIYACGQHATVLKLVGGAWVDTPDMVVEYNSTGTATTDTLFRSEEPASSATAVGNYAVAGNYGTVLMADTIPSRWRLGPIATKDWLNTSWGSPTIENNWLVSDQGRLYRLQRVLGLYSWLEVSSPGDRVGIDGMWGAANNVDYYFVNRDGQILHRTADGATREIVYQHSYWLSGIWGSSLSDIWAVGYDASVLHYDGETWSKVTVPNPQSKSAGPSTDKFGRPAF